MKKFVLPFLFILALLICHSGWGIAWNFVKDVAYVFYYFLVMLLPFLDLKQIIVCKVVTILIVQLLCGIGFYISRREERKIGTIVSGVADLIATALLVIA